MIGVLHHPEDLKLAIYIGPSITILNDISSEPPSGEKKLLGITSQLHFFLFRGEHVGLSTFLNDNLNKEKVIGMIGLALNLGRFESDD